MKRFFVFLILALISFSPSLAQTTPKKVALVWDTSYGMQQKDIQKEFAFLESYFSQNPEVALQLRTFSNTIIFEASYNIQNGNWTNLKTELANTIYDGTANFNGILDLDVQEILLVTNGNSITTSFPKTAPVPVNVICSQQDANQAVLQDLALASGGVFINVFDYKKEITSQDQQISVTGLVTDQVGPLSQVSIYSRETKQSAVTNAQGNYTINAKVNGILEFSYVGKNTVLTKVPSSGVKNIKMTVGNEVLDEVVLTAGGVVEEEPAVNTGNVMVEKRRLGYGIESISDEDITEQDITLENAIQGQFSNINLKGDQDISQFLSRGAGMSILLDQTGLIVIDGVPMNSEKGDLSGVNTPSNGIGTLADKSIMSGMGALDPDNIANITVLKGLAATNKYGTLGRNGVILITTKTFAGTGGGGSGTKKELVLGTTATYDGSAESLDAIPESVYIRELRKAKDIDQAYNIYLEQRKTYGTSPQFFIDAATYFNSWNNPYMVTRVLSNVWEVNPDLASLRGQAYKYQEFGLHDQAVEVYKQLIALAPNQIQHYRNLALALNQAGKPQEALEIYNQIDKKTITQAPNFGELRKTVVKEFKNLVASNKGQLNMQGVNPFYNNNITYTARVVFEWSDYDAEFELQIVNPQNRFFAWSHTPKSEAVRMQQELELGYGLEEYFMTATDKGEWLFNINYQGKRTGDNSSPTYLKITTYTNFGKENQTVQTKVISLYELNKQTTVHTINID